MNRTDLPIAAACQADWTTMTLADRGRFCGTCRKVVRELGQMTETQARALLASPPTDGLCVRYVHDERGAIVFRRDVVPVSRLSWRATALALALPLGAAACGGGTFMGSPPEVSPTEGNRGRPADATPSATAASQPVPVAPPVTDGGRTRNGDR
jgi:hypothetical protein